MNDEQAQKLGEHIASLRKERGMNIRQLAKQAGIDNGGLTRLEHGAVREPKPITLCAIARALDMPVADLFALAGYTVPQDLPSIEHYLRTKYDYIPADDVWEICRTVEQIAHIYSQNPVPGDTTSFDSKDSISN